MSLTHLERERRARGREHLAMDRLDKENERLRDLLGRIAASLKDGTIDIPDVARAIEAEIKESV